MGFLNTLFGAKQEQKSLDWKVLEEVKQLDNALTVSQEKPVVIFKHSTRCGISRMVLNQFQSNADFNEDAVLLLYLDLLAHRDISDAISEKFGILHQSPQLIILYKGQVVHHASHSAIVPGAVNRVLEA
ncbi:bacillithiol system redox-active protein YtxJ [Mesohalobacter halotolerans]|jgi:bacillithiol system protein YtxJ|uniref:Bacillithiol system redox-active protein YtxJ n=1 Tax=Mesohalobacter halotolerans TaxID=1883405 RepID=A0A4U5TPF8_9FLAO|nr:bacillithiol system redox-active protein YtxJ [Mesohalobacter halotolerans]MBS3738426.1 bacillithiol system redox-active protein YtxJ [Psychroflexus sp.]NBC58786.1 bacillithiol system redox-active protein YtxJ [Bacteroidota bacterium]TKS55581.1 bacillithiol system redox-active protein YtxJ [Mesohalobacter halotolerans]